MNSTVGDLGGNAARILSWARRAAEQGAHAVAFPEMAVTGYPIEDLALRRSFVEASRTQLRDLSHELDAMGLGELLVIVGYLDGITDDAPLLGRPAGAPENAAAFLHRGEVVGRYAKHHLPNYGVFDEFRHFVPGASLTVLRLHGVDVAVAICEDIWQDGGPVASTRDAQAGLLIVINGSPYQRNKDDQRLALVRRRAAGAGCTLAYVNMVGGQDELVFDGDSLVVDVEGCILARAGQFEEALLLVDLDLPAAAEPAPEVGGVTRLAVPGAPLPPYALVGGSIAPRLDDDGEVYKALVLGVRDYVRKNGFRSVVLGLSGGIDSALTAVIACDAVDAENVVGVSMPSRYSSEHSKSDAAELAQRTGLRLFTIPISTMVDAFRSQVELTGLAEENLQARVRGTTLMGLSNQHGHLVLATGNKSELAVGYSTLYGDSVGGYAPLKDVPKTLVWQLARWRNKEAEARGQSAPIPEGSISKEPSAELRPDQRDTDTLPSYDVLDDILDDYVELDRGSRDLVAAGLDPALVEDVLLLVDKAEFKRRQYPIGPKISFKAFGRDRRLPITNAWRENAVTSSDRTSNA
jgi:NAD+ synthase (glutamine-hydrolysing)